MDRGRSTTYGTCVAEKPSRSTVSAKGGAWSPTMTKTVGRLSGRNASCTTDWFKFAINWYHEHSGAYRFNAAVAVQGAESDRDDGKGTGRCEFRVIQ